MPLVSRLYIPEDYGTYGVIIAVTMLISIIASLQIHQAIVLPKLELHAVWLFQLSCIGAFFGGVLTSVAAYIYWSVFDSGNNSRFILSILTGLSVIAVNVGLVAQALAIRAKAFGCIGIASIVRACLVVVLQVILGMQDSGMVGLLAGYVAGEVGAAFYLFRFALPVGLFQKKGNFLIFRALIRQYNDFVIFGTLQEAMNSASQGVPVVLLAAYFGAPVAGFYAFSTKILMAPVNLIANALRQVLSIRFAEILRSNGDIRNEFMGATTGLAIPSLVGAFFLIPFTPDLFSLFFGEEWRDAGQYAQFLIVWCAFLIFNVPSSLIFRLLRKQKIGLSINILVFFTRFAVLVIGGWFLNPLETIFSYTVAGVIWNLIIILIAHKYATIK